MILSMYFHVKIREHYYTRPLSDMVYLQIHVQGNCGVMLLMWVCVITHAY